VDVLCSGGHLMCVKLSMPRFIMKSYFNLLFRVTLAVVAVVTFSSCEDKALVQENEQLRQRVSELKKEVDLLEINAGENPGDQTHAIKQANDDLGRALAELEKLDDEKEKLETAHVKLEKDLRDYQKKYQLK
jgi:cell division protein FtsB